jgi:CubicO group peptidase (beta-lactamase class C family)
MRSRLLVPALLALACASGPGPAPAPAPEAVPEAAAEPAAPRPVPERFAAAVAYSAEHGGRVLLVVERGQPVVESAQNGADLHAPHALYGGSDAFWGVLGAAAEEDGLLSLDERVADTLPEFPAAGDMTLRQLLDFTSGLESGADGTSALLELEPVAKPGERFQYGPSHLLVFREVLHRKLAQAGQDPDPVHYLERRVLNPIGAQLAGWDGDGASMAAADWARFGALLLGRGRLGDQEVVAEEYIEACFQGSPANPTFGLGLWLNAPSRRLIGARWGGRAPRPPFYPEGLPDLVVASGAGNQRLYVIPSLETVVVHFGARDRRFRDEDFLARLVSAAPGAA